MPKSTTMCLSCDSFIILSDIVSLFLLLRCDSRDDSHPEIISRNILSMIINLLFRKREHRSRASMSVRLKRIRAIGEHRFVHASSNFEHGTSKKTMTAEERERERDKGRRRQVPSS